MKGSMNNLTPNIIFPLAVIYTENQHVHVMCVPARVCVSTFISCTLYMLRGGYFGNIMWCVWALSELWVWQTHSPRAELPGIAFCWLSPIWDLSPCSLQAMQTMIEAFLWSVTIKGACLWGFLCFCLCTCMRWVIGWFSCWWRLLYIVSHTTFLLSLLIFSSLSNPSSFLSFFLFSCHCFLSPSLCPHSSPPSIFFLRVSFPPMLASGASLPSSPYRHSHSLGSPSVYYRPLTTSSLYGTFSF